LIQSGHVVIHPPQQGEDPAAIVTIANEALRAAFAAASAGGRADALKEALQSFAVGAGVYDILFRNAGPGADGVLNVEAVAKNAVLVASGGDPEQVLRQLLHEYVSFALFSVGAALGSGAEADVTKAVAAQLGSLRPQG
jgi:hypothetical protein